MFVNWLRDGVTQPAGGDAAALVAVELDPDTYVPTFEARGLSADMPVVVRCAPGAAVAMRRAPVCRLP